MALILRKHTGLLYLLLVSFCTVSILAKTKTGPERILSQDTFKFKGEEKNNVTISNRARSLKCLPVIKYFEVHLTETLKPGEGVGLTGDHIRLGEWQIDKSLEMKRQKNKPLQWFLKLPMCSALRIYYRFFIFYKDMRRFMRILYWESQQHARILEAYEMSYSKGSVKFGQPYALAVDGGIQQERGWLRNEYILQFKFIWPQHIRFTEFSHFIRKPEYILKLKAYAEGYISSESQRDIELQLSRFESEKSNLRNLNEQGEFYQPGDIIVFHMTMGDDLESSFILEIYTRQQELFGEVVIPSEVIQTSEGILELPVIDIKKKSRVGWLTLPFLRIEALPQAFKFNMRAGFHHYWPYNWPTLNIGQRGVGKSYYYHSGNAVENTIESFLKAQQVNSDMIQLDVQLTKDYVPVVWHDFGFFTATSIHNKRRFKKRDLTYVHIHDLSYQELIKQRVFMSIEGIMVEVTHLNTVFVPDEKRIFPQLAQVYQKLSTTLGIVVNIRWPQLLSGGTFESLQSLDKNRYVDEVLQTTMEFGCGRPLIMASFVADICTMLRFKQHMYPVVFITLGLHSTRESYADLRTHSLSNALQFVQASDILGTAIYAQEIIPPLNSPLLNMAFELHQLIFVWFDQLTDTSVLDYFKDQEMAGLIYNKIDSFMSWTPKKERKRFGFFEAQELQRIFLRQCIAAGNLTISEGLPDTHSPFYPRFRSLDEL